MADKYFSMPLDYQRLESDEAVQMMNAVQFSAYIWLMVRCWHEGSLPVNLSAVEKLSKYTGKDFKKEVWRVLAPKFTVQEDGRRHNKVIDEKRLEIKEKKDKQSEGGRAGAEKRWGSHSSPNSLPIQETKVGDGNQNQNQNYKYKDLSDFSNFKEEQITELRRIIALKLGHAMLSEANHHAYLEFRKRIERYFKKHTVKNKFEYALTSAQNLDKEFKNANPN